MEAANVIAFGAFVFSGAAVLVAHWSYRHLVQTEKRLMEDERLTFGPLMHPQLQEQSHARAVLVVNVVNLGRRKTIISDVHAADPHGGQIDVSWSDSIDHCGNPTEAHGLVLVDPKCILYARRSDGLPFIDGTSLHVTHSQSDDVAVLRFADSWVTWEHSRARDLHSGS